MSDEAAVSGPQTIEHGGMTITSSGTGRSADQIKQEFEDRDREKAAKDAEARGEEPPKEPEDEVSEAASKLGKKGGEAAAKARKAKAKEAEAEEADDSDEEDEGEKARKRVSKEIEEAKPHEKKKLASERVAEATRETAALKRQLAQVQKELEALRTPSRPPDPPDPRKYAGKDEELRKADLEYQVQAAIAKREQARAAAQAQAKRQAWIQEREDAFLADRDEALAADPDFVNKLDEEIGSVVPHYLLGPNEAPTQENFIATEIMSSPMPARLAVWFSENKDEYQRIAALQTPREITREVAKIEGQLAAPAGTPAKPSVSKAPPPVRPVTGVPHTAEQGWKPGMSLDDYAQIWRKQVLSR